MHVETEILADRQAKLVVTVEPERLERELKAAAGRIAKKLNIPGFRKGKAPYNVIVRYVGEGAVLEEALDPLGQAVYVEALKQSGVDPYAAGALTDMTREPMTMTFTVPLAPEINLGNYRDVRLPYEAPEVTDKDVEEALKNVREEQATLEPVERAIEWNDVALLDIHGEVKKTKKQKEEDGEEKRLIDRHDVRVLITEDSTYPVIGFPEKVLGMAAGEQREFEIKMPKDEEYEEEVRGKTLHFEVWCKQVYKRDVPEVNDEFAKTLGDFETLDDLRANLRTQLEGMTKQQAESAYLEQIFKELEPAAQVTFPPVMLDERIDEMIEGFERRLRERGLTLDQYFEQNGVTREQLRTDFTEEAQRSLKRALMLTRLVEAEGLSITDAEIDDEVSTMLLSFGAQAAIARQLFSSPDARRSVANRLLSDRATTRLVEIARGIAPEIGAEPVAQESAAEAEAEAKPAKKSRAKKAAADEGDTEAAAPKRTKKKSEPQPEDSSS